MKTTLFAQSRSTGRLSSAFSFCCHGLLILSSITALSAQAGDCQNYETVFIGGTSALSVSDFGTAASVTTPLTATTVITGSVRTNYTTDKITFTLPVDYKIDSASVTVTNYVAASGTPDATPQVVFRSGMSTYGSAGISGNGTSAVLFTSPLPAGQFDLQISAPSGLQSGVMIQPAFVPQLSPSVPTVTYGSASYVITLNISSSTVPITKLAGSYIGIGLSGQRSVPNSRIAKIVNLPSSNFKPIPNENLGSRLDMTITTSGRVTGRLAYGPTLVPFTGGFTVSNGKTEPKLTVAIPAYNRSLLLRFGMDGMIGIEEEGESYFYGELVQKGDEESDGDLDAGISGWKNTWTATNKPSPSITAYKTFSLSAWSDGGAPLGYGFGTVKAGVSVGSYQVVGTLADGEKFTTAGFYGPVGDILIYQYLYANRGKGSFLSIARGNSLFPVPIQVNTVRPNLTNLGGEFRWLKQPSPRGSSVAGPPKKYAKPSAGPSDTLYPEGFELYGGVSGAAYTPPEVGQVLGVNGSRLSSIPGIGTDIYFDDDQKLGVQFNTRVNITSAGSNSRNNLISVLSRGPYVDIGVASQLSFQSFDVMTGFFRGSFRVAPPLRTISFEGIFVYNSWGGYYQGRGYFIGNRFTFGPNSQSVMTPERVSGSVYIGLD